MELWEYSVIIVLVGIFILIGIRLFRQPLAIQKQEKVTKEIGIRDAHAIEKKVLTDTIETLKKSQRGLQNKINRQGGESDSLEIDENKPVPIEILKQAATRLNMNPEALDNNPELVEWLQEQAKDPEVKKLIIQQIKKPTDIYSNDPGV